MRAEVAEAGGVPVNCPTCGAECLGVSMEPAPTVNPSPWVQWNPPAAAGAGAPFVRVLAPASGPALMPIATFDMLPGANAAAGCAPTYFAGNGYRPIWGQGAVS